MELFDAVANGDMFQTGTFNFGGILASKTKNKKSNKNQQNKQGQGHGGDGGWGWGAWIAYTF